jgi:hypothetical protein
MREHVADRLCPEWSGRYWLRAHPEDRRFLAGIFASVPQSVQPRLLAQWDAQREQKGRWAGNLYAMWVRDRIVPDMSPAGLPFDATEDEIAEAAECAVRNLRARMRAEHGEPQTLALLGRTAKRYHVEVPACRSLLGKLARMLDAAWWRRALRKRFRVAEHAAIKAGCVHQNAARYVSDQAMRRHERHTRRVQQLLEMLEALNETTGEILSLADLHASSLANPAIRRVAMICATKDLERLAQERGFAPLFLTITCPSRMHAQRVSEGRSGPNEHYDGTRPDESQRYLKRRVWNSATRKLAHLGVKPGADYFGVRIVEPHHDATPHWHVLAFIAPAQTDTFVGVLREYALKDSHEEAGADEHRFTALPIDPAKGGAVGYVAKYISKNLDGVGVGADFEAQMEATAAAPRAVVWARTWNARQFQFFGVGAISAFRELRRLERVPGPLEAVVGELWRAARPPAVEGDKPPHGDLAAFIRARDSRQTRLALLYEPVPSKRYPGEQARRLRGVNVEGDAGWVPIVTRPDEWSIQLRDRAKNTAPWTRFNNSAPADLTGFSRENGSVERVEQGGLREKHPGWPPLTDPGHSL